LSEQKHIKDKASSKKSKDQAKELPKALAKDQESKIEKPKATRFTEEGFKIYTTEDLNIGNGKDTEDCPFDCNCCF
jgi:hypothetical protein